MFAQNIKSFKVSIKKTFFNIIEFLCVWIESSLFEQDFYRFSVLLLRPPSYEDVLWVIYCNLEMGFLERFGRIEVNFMKILFQHAFSIQFSSFPLKYLRVSSENFSSFFFELFWFAQASEASWILSKLSLSFNRLNPCDCSINSWRILKSVDDFLRAPSSKLTTILFQIANQPKKWGF